MSAFTPGPWEIIDKHPTQAGYDIAPATASQLLFTVAWVSRYTDGTEENKQKYEAAHLANARLISAAPEMYEALKAIDEELTLIAMSARKPTINQLNLIQGRIWAALAKAEGRS